MSHSYRSSIAPSAKNSSYLIQSSMARAMVFRSRRQPALPMSSPNMKLYPAAWNAHDADKAESFLTDDVTFFEATVGGLVKRRETAKKGIIESFIDAVLDSKREPIGKPIVRGETVVFEWRYSRTNTGDWADGANKRPAGSSNSAVCPSSDLREASSSQGGYCDAFGFFKQTGPMRSRRLCS